MQVIIWLSIIGSISFLIVYLISGVIGANFYPTNKKIIRSALKMADIRPQDSIIDLGCGDGRFLFEASKYSKHTVGYEINPFLVLFVKLKAFLIQNRRIHVLLKNFWKVNLSTADTIYIFQRKGKMKALEQKILHELKPNAKVIVYSFAFPNLKPTRKIQNSLYLYIL